MIIALKDVSKTYQQSNFSLKHLSFEVHQGEIIGLIGQNGTGKSTILKMVSGLIPYDTGEILYEDQVIKDMSSKQKRLMRKDIAYIFQNHNLLLGETVYYHLALVYKLNQQKVDEAAIDDILQFLGLSALKKVKCHHLSGGQQQKVAIAMAILQKPRLILCDEISAALDTTSEQEIFDLLAKLRKERGIAILMIAHNLTILKQYCDTVFILGKQTILDKVHPKPLTQESSDDDYSMRVKEFLLNE